MAEGSPRFRRSRRRMRVAVVLLGLLACHYDRTTGPPPGSGVATVVVTAPRQALAPGDTLQLTAQVFDSGGRVLAAEPVTWTSSTPAVAHVDANGRVVADSVGATTITASAGGQVGHTDLIVQVTVLCSCTEILDSTAVTLVSRDDSTGIYVFRVIRGPPPAADSGTILVGAESGGFMRRVVHSALVGDLLTVQTVPAYMEEAVQEGEFLATEATATPGVAPAPGTGRTWLGPWTTIYIAPGVTRIDENCCSLTLNGVGLSIESDSSSPTGPVKVGLKFTIDSGSIDFTPPLNIGARFKFFRLQEFHALVGAGLGLELHPYQVQVSVGGSLSGSKALAKSERLIIQQRPFATFIGPMPVVGVTTMKLSLQVGASISASAKFQGTFGAGFGVQAGVKWTRGNGWRPVSKASSHFEATAPEFLGIQGTATLKAAIVPEYSVEFYGAAGPFVNFEPYAQLQATADATFSHGTPTGLDWLTDAAIGLNVNLGAKISLLGRIDLAQAQFTVPLVKPFELVRDFSDGPLAVRTRSTGDDIPAGYHVRLRPAFTDKLPLFGIRDLSTSNQDTSIAANDSSGIRFDDVRSGVGYPHQVTLDSVPGNCYATNTDPDTVAIASGLFILLGHDTTDAQFSVHCIPLGHLRVRAVTDGPDAAGRFAVTLHRLETAGRPGKADAPLAMNIPGGAAPADTVIDSLIPVNPLSGTNGRLAVTLTPGRRNCATARPDTNVVIVQSGDTVATRFLVTCVPLGHIRLVTRTDDPDPASASDAVRYAPMVLPMAGVDTVPDQPGTMLGDDSTRVDSLVPLYNASGAPGGYAVALAGAPNRCSESGSFTRSVTVLPGDTAITDFSMHCVERLQVITRTTGPGIDPDGYAVVVDNADGSGSVDTVPAAASDTLGIAGVSPGSHTIALTGVDPTCVAPPPVDHTVSATDSTLVTFAVTCPAPAPPGDLQATLVDTTRVDLAWTPPAGSPVAQYRIYRDNALHDSSTSPAYSDVGLSPFTGYVYQVSSVDPNGLEGVRTEPLAVRTRDATPPTTPAALSVTAVSSSRIALAWQPATDPETGVSGYVVYRNGVDAGHPTTTAFTDTGLSAVTAYTYAVSALNGDGLEGARSAPATATTLDGTPPTAPPTLDATPSSTTSIALSWSAATDAESGIQRYNIYRDGTLAGTASTTTFTDPGLTPNTAYTYTVTAVNGAGLEGPPSPSATATTRTDQTPPPTPGGLSAIATSPTRIALQWEAVTDPESGIRTYRVYRDGALQDSSATTTFADTGLAPGTTHSYQVSAVNGVELESARSEPATATTPSDQDGDLVVYTTTSGTGIPTQFTVQVNKDEFLQTQPVAPTGSVAFNGLVPQEYHVRLINLPSSCVVQDVNARKVTVVAGTTVQTTFVVTCQ